MNSYISSRFNKFKLDRVEESTDQITFHLVPTVYTAICPICGIESENIHQAFTKLIFDSSYQGKKTEIMFKQRKFKCRNPHCHQKYFTEKLNFITGKRPYSSYLIEKIIKNKNKTIRKIAQIINEQDKVAISKTTIGQIINDSKLYNRYVD